MAGNKLVIGLDYGTTFTGLSYCETSSSGVQGDRIQLVHDWPSKHNSIGTHEKVPSEVAYSNGQIVWGSLIAPDVPRHMWTKLQLHGESNEEAAKIFQEISSSHKINDMQPVDVVADFLAQVKAHLVKNLDHKYGKTLWRTMPITLVVTVPAVWSDLAKSRTLRAVDKAGFNSLEFPQRLETLIVTEPEAAAMYTIKALEGTIQEDQFSVGDGFIVCDMGGGTVDLISYRIKGLRPTVIEEATVGSGAQCGGSFVDRAFLTWLERRLGTLDFVEIAGCRSEDVPRTSLAKKAARLLQAFRYEAKGGFSGTETNFLPLPYPLSGLNDESRGISYGDIRIMPEDMQGMFEKSLRCTYELITEQVAQARKKKVNMKYMFLVGGFAESQYMFNKLEDFSMKQDLATIKPVYAWSAVARGATTKGLELQAGRTNMVTDRICRRFYGSPCVEIYERGKHRAIDSYICQYSGVQMARRQVRWLINKGQKISTTETPHASWSCWFKFWATETRKTTLTLLAANVDKAPKRSSDKNVFTVAQISIDLTKVPDKEFKRRRSSDGRLYFELGCVIDICVQSALEYSFRVNGEKYGSLTATYE